MDEIKNKNVKKWILGGIAAIVVIGLAICFVIAYNNTKVSNNQTNTIATNDSNSSSTTLNTNTNANANANSSSATTKSDSKNLNITAGGSYDLSGEYEVLQ